MMIKRLLDIVAAGFGLLLLSPLLALVAFLVKSGSAGPIFFRHERMGRGFRPFHVFKFRTMVQDAAKLGGPITFGDDPRVTPIGKLLAEDQTRRTAATVQRAQGRHEPRRAPARGAPLRRDVSAKTTASFCKCGRASPISPRSSIATRPRFSEGRPIPRKNMPASSCPKKSGWPRNTSPGDRLGSTWQSCLARRSA